MLQGQDPAKAQDFILRQNLAWLRNGHNRLRRVVVRWLQGTELELPQNEEHFVLQFLASTHRLCIPQFSVSVPLSDMNLTATWIQCLGELIHASISCQSSALQTVLGDYLDELVQGLRQSKLPAQLMRETFLPIFQDLVVQRLNLQSVDPRLWVNLNLSSIESSRE